GIGRMEIIESSPPSKIVIQLDLAKPIEIINIVEFTLASEGDETIVTWDMHGPNPYISKLIGIFYDRDDMVGRDFEQGLANLKTIAER
ncbi:MAG: SRPBCC family protein, partial [Methylobacter sp.]